MDRNKHRYVEVKSLPPEEQVLATDYLERHYGKRGPVSVENRPNRKGLLWCGHTDADVIRWEDGKDVIEVCPTCSGLP